MYRDDTIMETGPYKGRELQDVPAEYFLRINGKTSEEMQQYIDDNMDVFKFEIKNRKPYDLVGSINY